MVNNDPESVLKEAVEAGVNDAYWRGCTATVEQLLWLAAQAPGKTLTHEQLLLFRDRLRSRVTG
jgi:hypothetical protein